MKTIAVDVSGHGLGHLSQVAPVIKRLRSLFRDIKIVIRTNYHPELVAEFIGEPASCIPLPFEPSLEMKGPVFVDREATNSVYRDFHDNWEANIAFRTAVLKELRPDLLVADIPYASLVAAQRLSIPSVALCSYSWLEVLRFFNIAPAEILQTIEEAYQSASVFLQPEPHMPMAGLGNTKPIGPIGRTGVRRGDEIRKRLALSPQQKLVLVTFGGMSGDHSIDLPDMPNVFWIVRNIGRAPQSNEISFAELDIPFIDVLASTDAVISKEGYGTLVEAACNGVRMLVLTRPDWPETPYFVDWAERNISFQALPQGSGREQLGSTPMYLLSQHVPPPIEPTGIREASAEIAKTAQL